MLSTYKTPLRIPTLNGKPLLTEKEAELAILKASKAPVYQLGELEKRKPELVADLKGKVLFIE